MKYEIEEETILKWHSEVCEEWQTKIEKQFPEAFKSRLEVGEWYKDGNTIICFSGKLDGDDDPCGYGIHNGEWFELNDTGWSRDFKPASKEEVEEALKKEAKKIGFKNGNFKCLYEPSVTHSKVENKFFLSDDYSFWMGSEGGDSNMIFENGVWAEIISVPIKEVTIEDIQEKYGCKIKIVE
jgi:hypothetical protein